MDIGKMMKYKEQAVKGLTGGIEGLFKKNKVIEHATSAIMISSTDTAPLSVRVVSVRC